MLLLKSSKDVLSLFYVGLSFLLFAVVSVNSYFFWDIPIAKFFQGNTYLERFSLIISYVFEPKRLLLFLPLLFFVVRFLLKKKEESNTILLLLLSLSLTTIISEQIKWLVGRDRPELLFSDNLYGFVHFSMDNAHRSFPSGHACSISAIFLSLAWLYPKHSLSLFLLTFGLSFTRILLEVHYLSDIFAAIWVAMLVSSFVFIMMKQENILFKKSAL